MAAQLLTYFQSYETDAQGDIFLTGIVNVEAYSHINVEIILGPHPPAGVNMTVDCTIGRLSGLTLGASLATFPLNDVLAIHTFNVIGPEFSIILTGGPANTAIPIQAWVLLS